MIAGLPILNYHGLEANAGEFPWKPEERPYVLSNAVFQRQMEKLKEMGFAGLSLNQLTEWLRGSRSGRKPVLITFDDGHLSHFKHAAPLLKNSKMKAIFFISAGLIGQKNQMEWKHLKELVRDGFEIGSHGFSHIPLTRLPQEELEFELHASKQKLEFGLGIEISSFSIPRGFFEPRIQKTAEDCGYKFIFTSQFDLNKRGDNPLCLKRLVVKRQTGLGLFTEWVEGNLGSRRHKERFKDMARRFMTPSFYDGLANLKNRMAMRSAR